MAGDIKQKFGSSNQAITCTINSLSNTSARESTAVDNSSNVFEDALVQVIIASASSSTSSTGYVNIYAYGTADGGTTYSANATGSDADATLTSPPNARLIGRISVVANSTTYESHPMSVAAAFGGRLPEKWGIIVENQSGATLSASGNSAFYQGVYSQYT